jgi:transcriptional regulator with XRE-family HTH domain
MKKERKTTSVSRPTTISQQLQATIRARGLTAYAVAKQAGVDPGVVARFMNGERDLRLTTADEIAVALGLQLCEGRQSGGRGADGEA